MTEPNVVEEFPRDVREIENEWIELIDGCRLAARIWLPADAESQPVPAIFEFIPYRTEGRLEGCGYKYRIFMNDNAGPSSHPFVAHGAIAYFSPEEGDAHLSFKIGLKYIKEHNSRIWDRIGAVHYAYLRFGNRSLAGKEYATASAAEDVRIFRYRDSQEAGLMNWLTLPETLSIHINRERSGVDLQFDLSVLDHRDAWMDLGACYRELQRIRR